MVEKCVTRTEAEAFELNALVSKAMNLPRAGVQIGNGHRGPLAASWDGSGECPPGWGARAVDVYVASASDAALPLPDELAAALSSAEAAGRLTPQERAAITAALATRALKNLEAYAVKPSLVGAQVQSLRKEV